MVAQGQGAVNHLFDLESPRLLGRFLGPELALGLRFPASMRLAPGVRGLLHEPASAKASHRTDGGTTA